MNRFEGKSVIITGAASGLGKAAASAFAAEGARLVLSDIDAGGLASTATELRGRGAALEAIPGDVTDEALAAALVEACVKAHGRLDIAVNNAGIAHPALKLHQYTAEQARQMFDVNLMSVFLAMKAELPVMEAQGAGVILNVASVAGVIGAPLGATYSAAKHGVIGLTKTAAVEYAKRGVRVNAICPAFTATKMVADAFASIGEEGAKRRLASNPMGRLASTGEIVTGMLWLCEDANAFSNGLCLVIDGGLTAT